MKFQNLLQNTPNLEIVEKEVTEIITEGDRIVGVKLKTGEIEAFRGTYTPSYAEAK